MTDAVLEATRELEAIIEDGKAKIDGGVHLELCAAVLKVFKTAKALEKGARDDEDDDDDRNDEEEAEEDEEEEEEEGAGGGATSSTSGATSSTAAHEEVMAKLDVLEQPCW